MITAIKRHKIATFAILILVASITGILIWYYCLQPSVDRDFYNASSKETYAMTLKGKAFDMPYRLYVPKDASKHRYPVVLWLCGSAQCGTDNNKQALYDIGFADNLIQSKNKDYKCIIIAPQIPKESLASNKEILTGYMNLVTEVQKKYNADSGRLYLAGFSMGGDEIWALLKMYPQRIAAAIPICGNPDKIKDVDKMKDVPIWVFHGKLDLVYPVKKTRTIVNALKAVNGNVKYTEYPFTGHVCWQYAFDEPKLFPWMFSQKRQSP